MKLFHLLLLVCPLQADATAFVDGRNVIFGVRGGADKKAPQKKATEGDYERAERAIFHGIETVESRLQQAVEDEVHSIFDEASDHHHRAQVADHAKTAVAKGSSKVKAEAREHAKKSRSSLPFLPKHAEEVEHHDHKILHAMEAAEKAVLHAVQDEVDSLFHDIQHQDDHPLKASDPKKTKEGIQKGVQKAKKHVEETHQERLGWMRAMDAQEIDAYLKSANSLYGMGY